MRSGMCHIGTSGWSYPHWSRGRFYPRKLRQNDWLAYYAQHFSIVEVNMTFYRLPTVGMLERWVAATPPDFLFAVKLWRRITHEKRCRNCESEVGAFFDTLRPLDSKLGVLLAQLPPSQGPDVELLNAFLPMVRRAAKRDLRVAFEFRDVTWNRFDVRRALDRHGAALCLTDMSRCQITEPNDDADYVYIRRHGVRGRYRGGYTDEQIDADATQMKEWSSAGRDVFIFYNNDAEGQAVDDARRVQEAIRE